VKLPPGDVNVRSRLLLVDNDVACDVLAERLAAHGFDVKVARSAEETSLFLYDGQAPEYAIVALKLPDLSGLKIISRLVALYPRIRIVVLTGYGSIHTAVEAIKLGATYYLTKPATADELVAALNRDRGDDNVPISARPMSIGRVEWEHINRVLHENAGNIAATARALSMHRRTLQRKLRKRPARA